jgi:HAD superfamily hydrolase (TIGR01450 family)
MALAEQFDGFLVDLDGVVWEGRELIPGAVETLRKLHEEGKAVVFVTNNSVRHPDAYAARLREAGVPVEDGHVVTAGASTAQLAAGRVGSGKRAFVIGAPGFKEMVASTGLTVLDEEAGPTADAVVVSGHREFDYAELLTATRALQNGAALFATSRDPTKPMPRGGWAGNGGRLAGI